MPVVLQLILAAILGYLWGSVPAGYWMGKLLRGRDFGPEDVRGRPGTVSSSSRFPPGSRPPPRRVGRRR